MSDHEHGFEPMVMPPTMRSQLIRTALELLGVHQYVLLTRLEGGHENCEHDVMPMEMHSAGLKPENIKVLLIDAAAAVQGLEFPGRPDGP